MLTSSARDVNDETSQREQRIINVSSIWTKTSSFRRILCLATERGLEIKGEERSIAASAMSASSSSRAMISTSFYWTVGSGSTIYAVGWGGGTSRRDMATALPPEEPRLVSPRLLCGVLHRLAGPVSSVEAAAVEAAARRRP